MIIARIIFLSILIGVHTVISSDINIARVYRQSESRGSYKYNHPPSAEIDEPIPDPIVHESQRIREPKSLKITENISVPEEQSADAKVQTETSLLTLLSGNDDIVVKITKSTEKLKQLTPTIEKQPPDVKLQTETSPSTLSNDKDHIVEKPAKSTAKSKPLNQVTENQPVKIKDQTDTPSSTLSYNGDDIDVEIVKKIAKSEQPKRTTEKLLTEDKIQTETSTSTLSRNNDNIVVKSGKNILQPKPLNVITEKQPTDAKIQTETFSSTSSYDNNDIVVKSAKNMAKSKVQSENKIPVAVVYEGTHNQRNHNRNERINYFDTIKPRHRTSSISRRQQRPHRQQRQHFEDKKAELEEIKNSTDIKDTASKEQVDGTTSIRKRTRVRDPVIPIVESENHVYSHTGKFQYSYEGGDGTKAFETGELKSIDSERSGEAVVGGFSYKDKEGNDFSLSYTADENGYRPVGAHLPTPPPIPPAIARALRYLATKTTPEPITKSYKK